MSDLDKEYEASLKSIETENKIDRIFYRPIGFRIARMLKGTGITPNMVTVVSIFVGAAVGFFFYHDDLIYNVCGILLLVCANILDCVDGQLARLTGIKSAIGRILDGVNAVAPGFVDTEWQKTKPAEIRRNIENKVSLGRFCDPEELAEVYRMLVENSYLNGEVIVVDGGYSYK